MEITAEYLKEKLRNEFKKRRGVEIESQSFLERAEKENMADLFREYGFSPSETFIAFVEARRIAEMIEEEEE